MTNLLVGKPLTRTEDVRMLVGGGRYLDDLGHDAGAVAFVRSAYAHARIVDIDVSRAVDVKGLIAIYTYEDLPQSVARPLPHLLPHPRLTRPRTSYVLANGEVNHVGEPIAMVVADTRYTAEDICERITVKYEQLAPVSGLGAAREAAHAVHPDIPDNVSGHVVQEHGDVEQAMSASAHTLELDLEMERSAPMPLETRGVLASWSETGDLTIYSPTQVPASVRLAVADRLDIAADRVHCVVPDVGGAFGMRLIHPWPEEVLVPWAAKVLGRDLKYTEDRREHFIASSHERAQQYHVRVGFDEDGALTALDLTFWHDNGAYTSYGLVVPMNTVTHVFGQYRVPASRVEFFSLYTNTVPVSPYRGAGRPQGCFVIEKVMDRIAVHLGRNRFEVRERNLIAADAMPYDHGPVLPGGRNLVYDSGNFPEILRRLRAAVERSDFRADLERRAGDASVGIGLALYVEATGVGPYEGARISILPSGEVHLYCGLSTQGQGHSTSLAQIAADELNVPLDAVVVRTGDTRTYATSVGTFASRTMVMAGSATALAARKVAALAKELAARSFQCEPDDVVLTGGSAVHRGDPSRSLGLGDLAILASPLRYAYTDGVAHATQNPPGGIKAKFVEGGTGLEAEAVFESHQPTFASGGHAVAVAVDDETAEVRILDYLVVHDCGVVVNPLVVEGQVYGGLAQGLAGALLERMAYDESGQLQNASFMDFLMPFASEMPEQITLDHLETPSPLNPIGVKGAGEAGIIPAYAAIGSAIEDALGVPVSRLPISPSQIFDLKEGASI